MKYYICSDCQGRCDPGELVNGVCLECLENQRQAMVARNKAVQFLNAPWEQMTLDFGGIRNAGTNCNGY